jgi:hypothetical protein
LRAQHAAITGKNKEKTSKSKKKRKNQNGKIKTAKFLKSPVKSLKYHVKIAEKLVISWMTAGH